MSWYGMWFSSQMASFIFNKASWPSTTSPNTQCSLSRKSKSSPRVIKNCEPNLIYQGKKITTIMPNKTKTCSKNLNWLTCCHLRLPLKVNRVWCVSKPELVLPHNILLADHTRPYWSKRKTIFTRLKSTKYQKNVHTQI